MTAVAPLTPAAAQVEIQEMLHRNAGDTRLVRGLVLDHVIAFAVVAALVLVSNAQELCCVMSGRASSRHAEEARKRFRFDAQLRSGVRKKRSQRLDEL
jgi:hypothetical protein